MKTVSPKGKPLFRGTRRQWQMWADTAVEFLWNCFCLLVLLGALAFAGGMTMDDEIAAEQERALNCPDPISDSRMARTRDQAAGRCDQPEGNTK